MKETCSATEVVPQGHRNGAHRLHGPLDHLSQCMTHPLHADQAQQIRTSLWALNRQSYHRACTDSVIRVAQNPEWQPKQQQRKIIPDQNKNKQRLTQQGKNKVPAQSLVKQANKNHKKPQLPIHLYIKGLNE